jgi:hypothetical protein
MARFGATGKYHSKILNQLKENKMIPTKIATALLFASFQLHAACLMREGTDTQTVLDFPVIKKPITINSPARPTQCGSPDCNVLRDDQIKLTITNGIYNLLWERPDPSDQNKLKEIANLEMKLVTSNTTPSGTITYLRSTNHQIYDYYLLYNEELICNVADARYVSRPDDEICKRYTFETFLKANTMRPPLKFVRPDNQHAAWTHANCGESTDPNTGGGTEPP